MAKWVKRAKAGRRYFLAETEHDPFFELTPAGAQALTQFLSDVERKEGEDALAKPETERAPSRIKRLPHHLMAVETDVLREFLHATHGTPQDMGTAAIYRILGAVCVAHHSMGEQDKVTLDERILEHLANPGKRFGKS